MKVKFNKSQLKIIDLLVNVKYFMTISDMSEKVNVSERSVYKNLRLINEKFKTLDIEGTRNVYGQGYYLGENSKQKIRNYLSDKNSSKYSSMERQYLEFVELLLDGKFSVHEISKGCGVSKQTVLKDVQELRRRMSTFKITIISNLKGHFLSGPEVNIRQFLFSWLYSSHNLVGVFETREIKEIKFLISQWLNSFENSNNIIYSDEFIYIFANFYALVLKRIFNGNSKADKEKYLMNSKLQEEPEYKFSSEFLSILLGDRYNDFEKNYLTSVLLGGQKRKLSKDSINTEISKIVYLIINSFKNLADCTFKNENKLHQDLVVHLATTFFRVKYQQQYQKSDFELIKENYRDIYIYTQMSIHPFERFIGASLNDYEVGLISIYFASQITRRKADEPKVLLVSSGSNGSAGFLLTQMVEQYPYLNFSLPISPSELQNRPIQEEVIITNISLIETKVPWLKVNSILTSKDFQNIDNFFQMNGITNSENLQTEYKAIMETVYDNTQIINRKELEKGIRQILIDKKKHENKKKRVGPLLSELLTSNKIKFSYCDSIDWENAIKLCAQPLVEAGNITNGYVDAMIKNVKENGPYINIGTEIALAHARPSQGVKKLGMSLLLLDHDINLVDEEHKIRLIIVLAASDSTSHLNALSELAKILGDKDEVAKILAAKEVKDIVEIIKKGEK
jgi:mannitol operon transcriptional antiterminator